MSNTSTMDQLTALRRYWGYDAFRPLQEDAITAALNRRDALVIMPTGGGKSLCYQVPAACARGLVLVISPLIALMDDQVSAAVVAGLRAGTLHSNCAAAVRRQTYAAAANGDLDLLYVSPERFVLGDLLEACAERIALIAVDEAHCVSHWGHDFRPEYRQLAPWFDRVPAVPRMALTATATPQVQEDIVNQLGLRDPLVLLGHPDRPNLIYRALPRHNPVAQILQVLARHQGEGGIIYCQTRKETERIAQALTERGIDAAPYHAGLPATRRAAVQDAFVRERLDVVVATIAFGMGVDKANIRYVYHYNPPKSLENYAQEIGRAGRDGKESVCQLLFCADDLNVLENFIYGDTPEPRALKGLIHDLFQREAEFDLSLYELANQHDIRLLVLRTLLTYLELDGLLEGGTPFYSQYKFKPLLSSAEILARFEGERREFLAALFRQAQKGRTWLSLDADAAATKLNTRRERIVSALDWLAEQGMLEVQAAGVRLRYRRLKQPHDPNALADDLHQRMAQREAGELQRLQQVCELAAANGCITAQLASHFGETLDSDCGHCSGCLEPAQPLPTRAQATIPAGLDGPIATLLAEQSGILDSPRTLTRFLCGVGSPQLSKAKLSGHPLFGRLESLPFAKVLERAQGWVSSASSR